MRLVLDCNVIIAAGLTRGTCAAVVELAVRSHEVVVSDGVIAEYRAVAQRPKHQRAHQALKSILDSIDEVALRVEPTTETFGLVDPDDEIFLQTAVAGGAAALVTGNQKHFPAVSYNEVEVLSPAAFLERAR